MKIVDLHCDTLYKFFEDENYSLNANDGHITESYLKNGGYSAQCFAIYIPCKITGDKAFNFFESQYDKFSKMLNNSTLLSHGEQDKIRAVLTVENAELLNNDITRIENLKEKGVKILGLLHNGENCLGYPHTADRYVADLPLKYFGKKVVEAINDTDIIIDVSHLNIGGFYDVANLCKKPFVATHSACRDLLDHSRNLYDFQIRAIANSGGVVGIPLYSYFLNGTNKTKISDIIRHLEHLIDIGGEDVAAIGTDFDGMCCELPIKNAGEMPILTESIIDNFGFKTAEKICHKNALRILK